MPRSKPGMGGEGTGKELSEGESECICQGDRIRLTIRFRLSVRFSVRLKVKVRVTVGWAKVRIFESGTG